MSDYKTIKDLDLAGKKVLVRLDLNVPIKEGKVKDTTRIDAPLETIKYIMENKGKAILMSHLGRPEGQKNPDFTLKPVAEKLSEKLGKAVKLAPDCVGAETEAVVDAMNDGDVVLLENLRFHAGEQENEAIFVAGLAKLSDVYINDAFGTAHRAHASTYGLPLTLAKEKKPIAAGFLMDKELSIWKPIVEGTGKSVAVIGGAKLKEKIKAVKKFSKTFDRIILGGVVANVFMNAAGFKIGSSKCEEKGKDYCKEANDIISGAVKEKIIFPTQAVLATADFKKEAVINPKEGIEEGHIIADVLPTEEDMAAIKEAERIVWFGPMGAYEFNFKEGTQAIVKAIGETKGYAVIGGGDLAAAAEGVDAKVSTGGGASIQYITSGKLDALEALKTT
ncbi:phosphoglycerate kinase [Candidatus Woesearchaeota archaeon]|nr:phosphoglycerate kinase [Candidatus Woesearchaeota archaeon]